MKFAKNARSMNDFIITWRMGYSRDQNRVERRWKNPVGLLTFAYFINPVIRSNELQ